METRTPTRTPRSLGEEFATWTTTRTPQMAQSRIPRTRSIPIVLLRCLLAIVARLKRIMAPVTMVCWLQDLLLVVFRGEPVILALKPCDKAGLDNPALGILAPEPPPRDKSSTHNPALETLHHIARLLPIMISILALLVIRVRLLPRSW